MMIAVAKKNEQRCNTYSDICLNPRRWCPDSMKEMTSKMVIDIAESCKTGNTTWDAQIPNMFFIPKTIGYLWKT
jgi:hypothetical protein